MAYHGLGDGANARRAVKSPQQAVDQEIERMYEAGKHEWTVNMGAIAFANYSEWLESDLYLRQARSLLGLADKPDPRVRVLRARAFAGLRRPQEAAKEYAAALQLAPDDPQIQMEALRNRGTLHVSRGEFAEASAAFEQAVQLRLQDERLWDHLAMAQLASGNVDGYRRTCAAMVEQLGQTQTSTVAYNMMDDLVDSRR